MPLTDTDKRPHRQIRSFVLREGRLTPGQQRAFDTMWPRWGLEFRRQALDLRRGLRQRQAGVSRDRFRQRRKPGRDGATPPRTQYLGVEVHGPGVGHLLLRLQEFGCGNVRVIRHDAVEVLDQMLPCGQPAGRLPVLPRPLAQKAPPQAAHPAARLLWTDWPASSAPAVSSMPPPTGRTTPST